MPQLFQVLRCYKCLVFQVHQTKKSNKWECKLCGEKQSIKRHYGLGTAKDCRIHVQKLNGMRGELDTLKSNQDSEESSIEDDVTPSIKNQKMNDPVKDSKWSHYIEEHEPLEEKYNENMTLGNAEVVLEIPKKRKKLNSNRFKRDPKLCLTPLYDNKIEENFQSETKSVSPIADVNTHSVISKMSQPDLLSRDLIVKEEHSNIRRNVTQKKFVPPMINKDSKWAQFTEDAEQNEEADVASSPNTETSQHNFLFSLCDDSELDNVLNV